MHYAGSLLNRTKKVIIRTWACACSPKNSAIIAANPIPYKAEPSLHFGARRSKAPSMEEESNTTIGENIGCKDVSVDTSFGMLNVIRPYGYSVSKCGYCKGLRSTLFQEDDPATPQAKLQAPSHSTKSSALKSPLASKSYSVLADSVSPGLYEGLINLGWRRSGLHLYKPQNFSSCCPTLQCRLRTREFKPSKSQRKVLKKMEKILGSSHGSTMRRKEELATVGTMATTTSFISTPTFTSKKQKRNHKKQQKMNERKSRMIPVKQQDSFHSDITMSRMVTSLPLSVEEHVLATGILQRLEQATTSAIQKYLTSSYIRNNCSEFVQQSSKEFNWKTSYRILPPSKRERKRSQVRAICSICAQISGQLGSTFSADPVPREQLVQHVVHAIKNTVQSLIAQTSNTSNGIVISSYDRAVSILSIEAHQPSGHISCTIRVRRGNPGIYKNEDNTDMNDSSSRKQHKSYQKRNSGINRDKLTQWYEKTTGKRLDLGSNKLRITIKTLPSHQSALNPDVHKLYAHYQHVVHGDPNPFSSDPNTDNLNGDRDNSDDEDEELKIETDNPSELDWGDAPTYFSSGISTMLSTHIQSLSKECRRAVLSNYYSFYQFLVEAPFSLKNVCKKQRKTPNSNDRDKQQMPGLMWDNNIDNACSKLPCGLYHQHYRIGGEFLIAVGVIDVLPTGLSSVYLFYHPSFSYELVALGKYAILKEIEFARDVLKVPYYYLGY